MLSNGDRMSEQVGNVRAGVSRGDRANTLGLEPADKVSMRVAAARGAIPVGGAFSSGIDQVGSSVEETAKRLGGIGRRDYGESRAEDRKLQ